MRLVLHITDPNPCSHGALRFQGKVTRAFATVGLSPDSLKERGEHDSNDSNSKTGIHRLMKKNFKIEIRLKSLMIFTDYFNVLYKCMIMYFKNSRIDETM